MCDPAFQDCRADILTYIAQETVEIDMGFWMMTDARYANALVAARQRGVRIRLLMDPRCVDDHEACGPQNTQLASAGIPMRKRLAGGILHWKVAIFAGQGQVEFAGANYAPFEMVPEAPYVNYTDELVYYTNDPSLVNSFKTKFDDLWTSTIEFGDYANSSGPLTRSYPTTAIDPALNFPPDDSYRARALSAYAAEPGKIDVQMFRITDESHTNAMLAAIGRGVPVRLITDETEYRNPDRLWDAYNVDRMYVGGVQVRFDAHQGIDHEKAVILYGTHLSIFGSSNWTSPSSDSQREHNYFTTKAWIFSWLVDQFERKWNNQTGYAETKPFAPLPPDVPSYVSPGNGGAAAPSPGITLSWNGGPWAHRYDVYFGTAPNPPLIASDVPLGPTAPGAAPLGYNLPAVATGTRYYWRIVSRTMAGQTAAGPIWSFTTTGAYQPSPQPHTAVDTPRPFAQVRQPFLVAGWALDAGTQQGNGVDVVHVYAYPASGGSPLFLGSSPVDGRRSDVGAVFGAPFANAGYDLIARGLPPGSYTLVVFAHSTVSGTFWPSQEISIQVAPSTAIVLDTPRTGTGVGAGFMVGGWALDFAAVAGDGVDVVHIYGYPLDTGGAPIFLGAAPVSVARPDVAAVYGSQFVTSGFNLLAPPLPRGRYRIVAYAHSLVAQTFTAVATADVSLQ